MRGPRLIIALLKINSKEFLSSFVIICGLYVCFFHVNTCFSVLNSQTRHQNGDTHFLTLEEILDETKLLDISMKQKQWLMTEVRFVFLKY